jgi:hypothetical protein
MKEYTRVRKKNTRNMQIDKICGLYEEDTVRLLKAQCIGENNMNNEAKTYLQTR